MKAKRPSKPTASSERRASPRTRASRLARVADDHVARERQVGHAVAEQGDRVEVLRAGCSRAASTRGRGRSPTGTGRWRYGHSRGRSRRASASRASTCSGWEVVKRSRRRPATASTRASSSAKSTSLVAVGVDRLAEQHHLGVAARHQRPRPRARSRPARPVHLGPAGARHDAEAADVVAALHRRHVGAHRVAVGDRRRRGPRRRRPCGRGRPPTRPASIGLLEQLRDRGAGCGSRPGRRRARARSRMLRALELRHAAADADPQLGPLAASARPSRSSEWSNFSEAFSRTAQVLRKTKSALSRVRRRLVARATRSSPATFSESLTFIWQPNVWMKKRLFGFHLHQMDLIGAGSA